MKKIFLAVSAVIAIYGGLQYWPARAITVNPASAVTGDSAAVGETIVYRDTNADFAARDVSVRGLASSGLVSLGRQSYTGVYASSSLVPTSSYVQVTSSSGLNIALVSTPNISTTAFSVGTWLIFTSTAAGAIIFQDDGSLGSSGLELGGATRAVSQYKTLSLMLTNQGTGALKWVETGYGGN